MKDDNAKEAVMITKNCGSLGAKVSGDADLNSSTAQYRRKLKVDKT